MRKLLLALLGMLFVAVAVGVGSFCFLDSKIKADYYFSKAEKIDQKHQEGSIEAIENYKQAIKIYSGIGDDEGITKSYIHLALVHYKFGNVLQVERAVLKALEIGNGTIPLQLRAKAYLLIAESSEPDKAIDYLNKALDLARQLDLKPQIVKAYFIMGKIREYQANFEEAEASYQKAIKVISDFPSTAYFVDVISLYEKLGELYVGDGDYNNAIKYYDEALTYSFKEKRSSEIAGYLKVLGDLYIAKNESSKACEFWRKSKERYAYMGRWDSINELDKLSSGECIEKL